MKKQRRRRTEANGLARLAAAHTCRRWQLQDAKARFSSLVELALKGQPQCVSRNGKDAVIVISHEKFMEATKPPQNMFDFLRNSPLRGSGIKFERMQGELRDVDL